MAMLTLRNPTSFKPEPTAHIHHLDKSSNIADVNQIHANMIKTGIVHQTIPANKLLTALCKTCIITGIRFFQRIQEPNTFMWNTIIRAFSHGQNQEAAIALYCQMLYNAAPHNLYTFPFLIKACTIEETRQFHSHIIKFGFAAEIHTANALLHAYARSKIETAQSLFDQMQERNMVTWTVIINGHVQSCLFKEALELFREMQVKGVEPDKVTVACVLSACAQLGALDQGRWIHAYIKRNRIQLDRVLGCALVDMYAKCGELSEAVATFKKIEDKTCVSLWTAMITGFALHGQGREAIGLFEEMEKKGIRPNEVTYTGLLTACSYSGLVDEGQTLFEKMVKCHQIRPSIEHYGCMVDLFSRAGLLKQAEDLIEAMPMKPNAAVWGALLTGCRIHGDHERGMRIGNILIMLEPNHGGRYVNLAKIFEGKGEWNRAAMMRKMMKDRGVCKLPGSSLINVDGRTYEFLAGDKSHPEREKIYAEWSRILDRLKDEGYVLETQDLLHDLEEEEKETAIHCHSEKLAIAFALIKTTPESIIHIIKNLRVCKDCHNVSKLISKVYNRKIIMRDRSRYHIFVDGHCSCRDYW